MDHETYADPEVAALLRAHFMPIRVDADARPDLAERYADWGWPATAVLTSDARPVLELRGYQDPREFAALLRELVADQRAGTLRGRKAVPAPAARDADLVALRRAAEPSSTASTTSSRAAGVANRSTRSPPSTSSPCCARGSSARPSGRRAPSPPSATSCA
jgi:hypothetical protein